jgi:hypothetical protein
MGDQKVAVEASTYLHTQTSTSGMLFEALIPSYAERNSATLMTLIFVF